MNSERGDAGSDGRVVRRPPKSAPPCPQRCWEQVGVYTWAFTKGSSEACRWDAESKQWTQCVPNESEQ